MPSEVFELYLLLQLKDYWSGGLSSVEAKLHAAGAGATKTLRDFQMLRAELSRNLTIAGIGVGGLALLYKGIETAASFEEAMTELRLSIERVGPGGARNIGLMNDQMARAESLAVSLGNRLPMTTQSAVEMLTKLRQGGLDFEKVLGGAGETVAKLGILTHEEPAALALEFARFSQEFKLSGDETKGAANVFLKGYRTVGLTPSELMETFKYFQTRVGGALGLTGTQGAQTAVNLMAMLARHGIVGRMAGTETAEFFGRLAAPNHKMLEELEGFKKKYKIDLTFYDKKGKFLGIDNAITQMGKLQVLTQQEQIAFAKIAGGERAMGLVSAFAGGKGEWDAIVADMNKIPDVEDQMTEKIEDFNVKLMNVKTTLENIAARGFMPMVKEIEPLLQGANDLASIVSDFLKEHQGFAQILGDVVGLGTVALVLTGTIKAGTMAWGLYTLASTAATRALQGEAIAATEAGAATAAANVEASTFGSRLAGLSKTRIIITIAAVLVGFELIKWLREQQQTYEKDMAEKKDAANKYGAASVQTWFHHPDISKGYSEVFAAGEYVKNAKTPKEKEAANLALKEARERLASTQEMRMHQEETAKKAWEGFQFGGPEILPFTGIGPLDRLMGRLNEHPLTNFDETQFLGPGRRAKMVEQVRGLGGAVASPEMLARLLLLGERGELAGVKTPGEKESFKAILKEAFGDQNFKQAMEIAGQDKKELGEEFSKLKPDLENLDTWLALKFPQSLQQTTNALDQFKRELQDWQPPPAYPGTVTPGGSPTPSPTPVPSRAAGGDVIRSGFVNVHRGERIVPAHVTSAYRGSAATQVFHVTYAPVLHVGPGTDPREFERMLWKHSKELADILGREVGKQRERA